MRAQDARVRNDAAKRIGDPVVNVKARKSQMSARNIFLARFQQEVLEATVLETPSGIQPKAPYVLGDDKGSYVPCIGALDGHDKHQRKLSQVTKVSRSFRGSPLDPWLSSAHQYFTLDDGGASSGVKPIEKCRRGVARLKDIERHDLEVLDRLAVRFWLHLPPVRLQYRVECILFVPGKTGHEPTASRNCAWHANGRCGGRTRFCRPS